MTQQFPRMLACLISGVVVLLAGTLAPRLARAQIDITLKQIQGQIDNRDYVQAIDSSHAYLKAHSGNRDARFLQAVALAGNHQDGAAINAFESLAHDFPLRVEPANDLAVLYARQGKFDESRKWLERAMATQPAYAVAHRNLGDVYTALADMAYRQALGADKVEKNLPLTMLDRFYYAGESVAQGPSGPLPLPGAPTRQSLAAAQGSSSAAASRGAPVPGPVVTKRLKVVPKLLQAAAACPTPTTAPTSSSAPASSQVAPATRVASADTQPTQPSSAAPGASKAKTTEPAAQATAPQPVAKPAPVQTPPADDSTAVINFVRRWAQAWAQQDYAHYVSFYSASFDPGGGQSLADWKAVRKQRLARPDTIHIVIERPHIKRSDNTHVSVSFVQKYSSPRYSDVVDKTLFLEHTPRGWRILRETTGQS